MVRPLPKSLSTLLCLGLPPSFPIPGSLSFASGAFFPESPSHLPTSNVLLSDAAGSVLPPILFWNASSAKPEAHPPRGGPHLSNPGEDRSHPKQLVHVFIQTHRVLSMIGQVKEIFFTSETYVTLIISKKKKKTQKTTTTTKTFSKIRQHVWNCSVYDIPRQK